MPSAVRGLTTRGVAILSVAASEFGDLPIDLGADADKCPALEAPFTCYAGCLKGRNGFPAPAHEVAFRRGRCARQSWSDGVLPVVPIEGARSDSAVRNADTLAAGILHSFPRSR